MENNNTEIGLLCFNTKEVIEFPNYDGDRSNIKELKDIQKYNISCSLDCIYYGACNADYKQKMLNKDTVLEDVPEDAEGREEHNSDNFQVVFEEADVVKDSTIEEEELDDESFAVDVDTLSKKKTPKTSTKTDTKTITKDKKFSRTSADSIKKAKKARRKIIDSIKL